MARSFNRSEIRALKTGGWQIIGQIARRRYSDGLRFVVNSSGRWEVWAVDETKLPTVTLIETGEERSPLRAAVACNNVRRALEGRGAMF